MNSKIRIATYNASLNRDAEAGLILDLADPGDEQAQSVAEVIQNVDPDVLLINEFDYDSAGGAARLFLENYLKQQQGEAGPVEYPFFYVADSNTGDLSGFDLNNDGVTAQPSDKGTRTYGDDSFGFGEFPGKFGFVILSKYEIDADNIRTFQNFLWKDMPGALLTSGEGEPPLTEFYSPEEIEALRLSSKNHVDLPVIVDGEVIHVLASHPTPPTFDGPEDRNGQRNHDEIRFWADYIAGGEQAGYIYDDAGATGGLEEGARFVILGDQNADPFDGDSVDFAIRQLLDNPAIIGSATDPAITPASEGGVEDSTIDGGVNGDHGGDPAYDTADFGFNRNDPNSDVAPGNLRVDHVLPSQAGFTYLDGGVFWPTTADPDFDLGTFEVSDHHLVYADLLITNDRVVTVTDVAFAGIVDIPTGTEFDGTEIGGLSSIAYDPESGTYLVIVDSRGDNGPTRFYEVAVDLADGMLDQDDVEFLDTTQLTLKSGISFDALFPDPEGIALTAKGEVLISSERDFSGDNPAVYEFTRDGVFDSQLPLDIKFQAAPDNGVRTNEGFESLTVTPDQKHIYTATETALRQDGPAPTLEAGSPARIVKYDATSKLPVEEFVYEVGPIRNAPNPAGSFANNGLVELLALDNRGTLLALERSFSVGVGNVIELYLVETDGATDVSGIDALATDGAGVKAVKKTLLADLADFGITPDNVEGMTLGPVLPDGRQSLVLVADNNFSDEQTSQFITLALELGEKRAAEPMLVGKDGWTAAPLLTIGGEIDGYAPIGVLDGIGAFELDESTVRVFVNHEVAAELGYAYEVDGVTLTGARISYFDIDKATYSIIDGDVAIKSIYDQLGKPATMVLSTDPADPAGTMVPNFTFENKPGFERFCSAQLVEAEQFGEGNGLVDRVYFTNEETGGNFSKVGGNVWALDTETGDLWALPAFGRGGWENVTEIDTGTTTHVAFLLGDDTSPFDADGDGAKEAAPAYLFVGEKSTAADADFLERNGLKDGQLYVWAPDDQTKTSPEFYRATDSALSGEWKALNAPPKPQFSDENGVDGYDEFGFATQRTLWTEAEKLGAYGFSRPEDVATNPFDGTQAVMASTGRPGNSDFNGADQAGDVYLFDFDFSAFQTTGAIKTSLDIIYDGDGLDSDGDGSPEDLNGDGLPDQLLRSPDNLDWADDGFIYVQEDGAYPDVTSFTQFNPEDAGIARLDVTIAEANGELATVTNTDVTRIFEIDQTAQSPEGGAYPPISFGDWESSGILDVSSLFGKGPGELFLGDVQAHSLSDQDPATPGPVGRINDNDLVEGGQLLFLAAPGVEVAVGEPVEPVYLIS